MYLADHAWPDLAAYFEEESLALVPLGSTEQHGPPAAATSSTCGRSAGGCATTRSRTPSSG